MNARNTSSSITAAALLTSMLLSTSALAERPNREAHSTRQRITVVVDATGLDVASAAGAARLYREIVVTAKRICRSSAQSFEGVQRAKHQHDHVRPCVDEAVAGALRQVADATGLDLERVANINGTEAGLRASR